MKKIRKISIYGFQRYVIYCDIRGSYTENECVTEIEVKLPNAVSEVNYWEKENLVSVFGIWVRKSPLTLSS